MARGVASAALLILSLLLVAGFSAASVSDDTDIIRLPSDDARGLADARHDAAAVTADDAEKRPWTCCNLPFCTKSWPPICKCMDKMKQCPNNCNKCEKLEGEGHERYVCLDTHIGDPGPTCEKESGLARMIAVVEDDWKTAAAVVNDVVEDDKRPWECCNLPLCTKSWPPICKCMDKMKQCPNDCNKCKKLEGEGHERYVCLDQHIGDPGPKCDKENGLARMMAVVADDWKNAAAAVKDVVEDDKRPWECCDLPLCTKSWPPVCKCMDKMKKCPNDCNKCKKLEGSGHERYVCLDQHRGDPGPKCEKENGLARMMAVVEDDWKNTAAAAVKDDKRPWECCNRPLCTKSWPPVCKCMDKVKQCPNSCNKCQKLEGEGHERYVCLDTHIGDPGPTCEKKSGLARMMAVVEDDWKNTAAAAVKDDKRPWECCNRPLCTKSWPPVCKCMDKVKQCPNSCNKCQKLEGEGHERYVCLDTHIGDPGPTCEKKSGLARMMAVVEDDWKNTAAATKDDGEDDKRPWECCNLPLCTKSAIPTCKCMDKMKKCPNSCRRCQEVEGSGHKRFVCLDTHHGNPGPVCDDEKWTPKTLAKGLRFFLNALEE